MLAQQKIAILEEKNENINKELAECKNQSSVFQTANEELNEKLLLLQTVNKELKEKVSVLQEEKEKLNAKFQKQGTWISKDGETSLVLCNGWYILSEKNKLPVAGSFMEEKGVQKFRCRLDVLDSRAWRVWTSVRKIKTALWSCKNYGVAVPEIDSCAAVLKFRQNLAGRIAAALHKAHEGRAAMRVAAARQIADYGTEEKDASDARLLRAEQFSSLFYELYGTLVCSKGLRSCLSRISWAATDAWEGIVAEISKQHSLRGCWTVRRSQRRRKVSCLALGQGTMTRCSTCPNRCCRELSK